MNDYLEIITAGDLIWENGIEFAINGLKIAQGNGVNFTYKIFGDGPLLEAVAFAIHDLDLSGCCKLIKNLNSQKIKSFPDIFLMPAVSPDYKFSFEKMNSKKTHYITTSLILESSSMMLFDNFTLIPRWDSKSIANAIISLYKRKIF